MNWQDDIVKTELKTSAKMPPYFVSGNGASLYLNYKTKSSEQNVFCFAWYERNDLPNKVSSFRNSIAKTKGKRKERETGLWDEKDMGPFLLTWFSVCRIQGNAKKRESRNGDAIQAWIKVKLYALWITKIYIHLRVDADVCFLFLKCAHRARWKKTTRFTTTKGKKY